MAKDVGKINVTSTGNCNSENNSLTDKQKVPPLRIVLNTSGAQKSVSSSGSQAQNQQPQDLNKSSTSQDGPAALKGSGKLRSKLGTGSKQNLNVGRQGKDNTDNNQNSNSLEGNEASTHKVSKGASESKESANPSQKEEQHTSHLRRITRRSQRATQSLTNEDDESMTSMTSIDDNANANANDNPDGLETNQGPASSASGPNQANNLATGTTDTPKRHKRRKLETSESLSEYDTVFNYQNYRLPMQNSFELFKNIRKQIDEKLKTMTAVHPRTPYGFKDYMLSKGAYLLDGNRLGNGTNLFMNEDGGLHLAPIGKYHVLRANRINYSVPNRAKVPLGLPINSPLYNLFIEQEKERYKMRIQHIKEREKLTLAAEQEIVRVYSQAAMAAANQSEPLSACTMLMHQEIYNSMDADSPTNLNEDEAINEAETNSRYPDRVRTRRRNAATTVSSNNSPNQAKENCNVDDNQAANKAPINNAAGSADTPGESKQDSENKSGPTNSEDESPGEPTPPKTDPTNSKTSASVKVESSDQTGADSLPKDHKASTVVSMDLDKPSDTTPETKETNQIKPQSDDAAVTESTTNDEKSKDHSLQTNDTLRVTNQKSTIQADDKIKTEDVHLADDAKPTEENQKIESASSNVLMESKAATACASKESESSGLSPKATITSEPNSEAPNMTEKDEKEAQERKFLEQLQDIDDKWEKIRKEMLTRHVNEADSLHSIQKLEWEWKTKEIGFCDVRTTPVIDDTLVPKLKIQPQDY